MKRLKKALTMICLSTCAMILLASHTFAYVDPSVMTYTIQVVAGVVIAVGAVVGVVWRRMKRKVQDKLGIDENAKKEVEDDVVEFQDDSDEV